MSVENIMKIKIMCNLENALQALDNCGYDNNFSFHNEDNIVTISVEKESVNVDEIKEEIFEILDNCGYDNNFSFEIVK